MKINSLLNARMVPLLLAAQFFAWATPVSASNPIFTFSYAADPAGHVFGDRLYLYASHDRNDATQYDMIDYHAYSTVDLQNWEDDGVLLTLSSIPWAKAHLWAPDCVEKNGRYYLYFPADTTGKYHMQIGVATSSSPTGPFTAEPLPIPGVDGIDPAVFFDDNGTAYMIWAGGGPKICKLSADMKSLDATPTMIAGQPTFFEGPWLFKHAGTYYLTYAAFEPGGSGRGGHGQHYDYATARSVMGPYTYRGTFTETGLGDSNIQGSQFEYRGKWYSFYHESSESVGRPGHGFKRCVDLDALSFGPDGSIEPLVWTKTGPPALQNLDPFVRNRSECMNGCDAPEGPLAINIEPSSEGGLCVGSIKNGAWTRYANVDFGHGAGKFQIRVATPLSGGQIELHLDTLDGPLIGTCSVPNTGGWQTWQTAKCLVSGAPGIHTLYFKFTGTGQTGLFNIGPYRYFHSAR